MKPLFLKLSLLSALLFYLGRNVKVFGCVTSILITLFVIYKIYKNAKYTTEQWIEILSLLVTCVYVSFDHLNIYNVQWMVVLVSLYMGIRIARKTADPEYKIDSWIFFTLIWSSLILSLSAMASYFGFYHLDVSVRNGLFPILTPTICISIGSVIKQF